MAGKHRAARSTHRVRITLLCVAGFLALMWVIGHHAEQARPTMAVCTAEDGSTPGQAFPCVWDASTQGNGHGMSYVLTSH